MHTNTEYEAEAVINYIAALGFTFTSDTEIQPLAQLAAQFDLARVHAGGAQVFSVCVCVCVCARARACVCVRMYICIYV